MSTTPNQGRPISSVPERVLSPRSAAADARRAARREQMRDFYGLKRDGAPSLGSPPASERSRSGGGHSRSAVARSAAAAPPSIHELHAPSTSNPNSPSPRSPNPTSPRASPNPRSSPTLHSANATPRASKGPSAARDKDRDARRDLSSPSFVPAEYYDDLIRNSSLADLLRTTSTLANDIGRLHSSRHTLVYNHHHQLFSAGDTIAVLNTRTPQLLSIVTDLQERFSEMSQLTDSVTLPERNVDDAARAKAVAEAGIERVKLMRKAEMDPEAVQNAWRTTEESLRGRDGVEDLVKKGREVAGIDE